MIIQVDIDQASGPVLLESIERGDQIDLQKGGRTIAKVTPEEKPAPGHRTAEQIADSRAALAEMDALSRTLKLGPFNFEEFKADRDAGRK